MKALILRYHVLEFFLYFFNRTEVLTAKHFVETGLLLRIFKLFFEGARRPSRYNGHRVEDESYTKKSIVIGRGCKLTKESIDKFFIFLERRGTTKVTFAGAISKRSRRLLVSGLFAHDLPITLLHFRGIAGKYLLPRIFRPKLRFWETLITVDIDEASPDCDLKLLNRAYNVCGARFTLYISKNIEKLSKLKAVKQIAVFDGQRSAYTDQELLAVLNLLLQKRASSDHAFKFYTNSSYQYPTAREFSRITALAHSARMLLFMSTTKQLDFIRKFVAFMEPLEHDEDIHIRQL